MEGESGKVKGEIEVFAPSLLSVLFPGNAILHGGKRLESMIQWKWWKSSHKFLSSSLVPQRKMVCDSMCNNTVMRYN